MMLRNICCSFCKKKNKKKKKNKRVRNLATGKHIKKIKKTHARATFKILPRFHLLFFFQQPSSTEH